MGLVPGPNKADDICGENEGNGNNATRFHCKRICYLVNKTQVLFATNTNLNPW
jgi:hypothetical protein